MQVDFHKIELPTSDGPQSGYLVVRDGVPVAAISDMEDGAMLIWERRDDRWFVATLPSLEEAQSAVLRLLLAKGHPPIH